MSESAAIFRKGRYVTEKDLDIIINIFKDMNFVAHGKSELDEKDSGWVLSFINDDWIKRWEGDYYQENCMDDNDHIIIYFYKNARGSFFEYIPSMKQYTPYYLLVDNMLRREKTLLEFLHRYFILFPEDVFWGDYFYTKDDIDKVYAKVPWNENWCYEDPGTF